jgi:glycosyltransferase involved in cell wall biosynthesis
MKILHAAFFNSLPIPGIANQMQWEQLAARANGLAWDARIFCVYPGGAGDIFVRFPGAPLSDRPGFIKKACFWVNFRVSYYTWLSSQAAEYDAFLLRYSVYDPFQLLFLIFNGKKCYLVHHTLEVNELSQAKGRIKRALTVCAEKMIGSLAVTLSRGLVGVTSEILQYERGRAWRSKSRGYVYPNGILYDAAVPVKLVRSESRIPVLLFVASHFAPWHGLDLLLDCLQDSKELFVLHLVGKLTDTQLKRASGDDRVIVHGRLDQSELRGLSEECWVGLSSFALFRQNMHEACTLKVRDYLRNGIPVYAGYQDVFPADFPFFRKGPPDIHSILEYANTVFGVDRKAVAEQARPFISKDGLLKRLYSDLVMGEVAGNLHG